MQENITRLIEEVKSNTLHNKTIWWIVFSFFLFVWTVQLNPPVNTGDLHTGLWGVMLMQAKDITNNDYLGNVLYGYNRALRLTVPVIMKLLSISSTKQMYLIQLLISFIFQLLLVKLVYRINKGHLINTALFCIACTYCYFSNTATGDTFGHADTFAFLFILISIYSTQPIIVAFSLFCAIFANERTLIITLPAVWFWWFLQDQKNKKLMIYGAVPLAVIGYFIGKYTLLSLPNFKTSLPDDFSLGYLLGQHSFFSIFIFTFKGLWLFVFLLIVRLKKIPFYLIVCLVFSAAAFVVADQTRGISFLFPLFLLVLSQLNKFVDKEEISKITIYCLIACVAIPNIVFYGHYELRPSFFYIMLEKVIFIPIQDIVASLVNHP